MTMGKQRGTFSYPGSKTAISPWIIDYIPEHKGYIEPFGGAGSVLVRKQRSELEVFNDINSDCVTFFKAIKNSGDKLKEWVDNTPYSRELFNDYVESYPDWPDDTVEYAGRFLYVQNAAFGGKGVYHNTSTFSITTPSASRLDASMDKIWSRKPDDITWLKERFKEVCIEHMDYSSVIEKYDSKYSFFYFDPPYVDVGEDYYQTEDGGFDHKRFVSMLDDIDGKWLLSYDENIPPGLGNYHTISRTKEATMSVQRPEKTETLTMNYDPEDTPMFREQEQQGLEAYE